ncbi:MAG: DUF6377 domain-containing protein [Candidatus Symbiothrix sp.]|jgi:hypothetical protein|nr:DUF6377 domain-containing protein [Candidatus Symbiothrix sp.]
MKHLLRRLFRGLQVHQRHFERSREIAMTLTLLVLFLFIGNTLSAKTEMDSIFHVLAQEMNNEAQYTLEKEQRITKIKEKLEIPGLTVSQEASIYNELFKEYNSFQVDSAVYYLELKMELAKIWCDIECLYNVKIDLSFSYWIRGRFIESVRELESLDWSQFDRLPEWLLAKYYEAYKRIYRYYAENDDNNYYFTLGNQYRDSLLNITPKRSQSYTILSAEKLMDENQTEEAKQLIINLIANSSAENHDRAIMENVLANIYKKEGNRDMQMKHYALSAIYDIRNAVKENASMMSLAFLFYEKGDIDKAYKCIRYSLDDAVFCNARFRTFEISNVFPIIDTAHHQMTTNYHAELKKYLILVSLLSLFLIVVMIYVYRQMKRIGRIRKELHHTNIKQSDLNSDLQASNLKLQELNNQLSLTNLKLTETNRVKEAYLGKFIDLCSNYIEKLDNYRRRLNKIANTGKLEDLFKSLKSSQFIKDELSTFHTNFDETFLRIYPGFVDDFNALLPANERQVPKQGELLNTELRIYALIRLGINDSAKIADFLRYSITTVYTYRSKLKHKSFFPQNFEEQVMKIGIIEQ